MRRTLGQPRLDVGAHRPLPRMNFADDSNQIVREGVLQKVGCGSCLQRAMDVFIAVEHRQHHDAGVAVDTPDRLDRVCSTQPLEPQIHQRHVWSKTTEQLDGLVAAGGRRDHFHVRLPVDDERDAFADDPVIVNAQNADLGVHVRLYD